MISKKCKYINVEWGKGTWNFKIFCFQVIIFPPIYDQQIQACSMFDKDMVTENSQEAGHN